MGLMQKYNIIGGSFDGVFFNSVTYASGIRAAGGQYKFNYSGTYLGLKVNPSIYSLFPSWTEIVIKINGAVWQVEEFINTTEKVLTLPAGVKVIELIEGATTKPTTTILGTFLTSINVELGKYSKITPSVVSEKLVFLGDSITVGTSATTPSVEGFAHLFRQTNEVGILGYGYGTIKGFAETTPLITETVGHITTMFSNVTTTKKLVICLGTNDFALYGTAAATFKTWYGNLVDAVNISDSTIQIYCVSPLIRVTDGALLDDYRTAIDELCTARLFCTHIVGKTILITSDLADNVHPHTAGHLKYYNAIKIINE